MLWRRLNNSASQAAAALRSCATYQAFCCGRVRQAEAYIVTGCHELMQLVNTVHLSLQQQQEEDKGRASTCQVQ
jgi:hypothetical protein